MKKRISLLVITLTMAGIATVAQGAQRFAVQGAASATDSTMVDKFTVTDSGFIGIGTNTPTFPFHVIANGDNNAAAMFLQNKGRLPKGANDAPGLLFYRNNLIDPLVPSSTTSPAAGDRLGFFGFGSDVGGFKTLAVIQSVAETPASGTWGASNTNMPTYMSFNTTLPGANFHSEKVRITGSGNVGIGTTSPAQKLEVNGGVRYNTTSTKPSCSVTIRGTAWFSQGAAGVADSFEVCAKDAAGSYAWVALY